MEVERMDRFVQLLRSKKYVSLFLNIPPLSIIEITKQLNFLLTKLFLENSGSKNHYGDDRSTWQWITLQQPLDTSWKGREGSSLIYQKLPDNRPSISSLSVGLRMYPVLLLLWDPITTPNPYKIYFLYYLFDVS